MTNRFALEDIQYVLGEKNISIRNDFPEYAKVIDKTGIEIVHETVHTSIDLAHSAIEKLLAANPDLRKNISCVIFVSQSPVNFLPNSACILQNMSGLNSDVLAFDINQGCSGFVQALSIAVKMVDVFKNIVIVCSDTYRSKLERGDRSTSTIFSDAASAIWISNRPMLRIQGESHFTDGSGAKFLEQKVPLAGERTYLHMSGADVLLFSRRIVPLEIRKVLLQSNLLSSDIQTLFLHQASKLVLDGIKEKFDEIESIPENIESVGNTVSSSIPILMAEFKEKINNEISLLCGFGVGLSTATIAISNR